jgi:malonyl-CoA O-methyltransferase
MPLYREYLPATGAAQQALVLLHGWGSNREVWRPLLAELRSWADITLLDLPGCAPGAAAGSAPLLSDLLAGILEHAPERAVYVGWSLGGQLAMALAAQSPQRVSALVTICSNPTFIAVEDWPGMHEDDFRAFRAGALVDPAASLKRFDALQVTGSRRPRRFLRELQRQGRDAGTRELLAGLDWLATLDQRDVLSTLTSPQLHLLAQEDALVPARVSRFVEAQLTHASLAEVKLMQQTSHLAPLDAPVELAREICGFLSRSGLLSAGEAVAPELQKQDVATSFSRAAATYDAVARLQREVGEQLLNSLDGLECAPTCILDLGCGTGHFCHALRMRYPTAQFVGLDIAEGMVDHARRHCHDDSAWLVGDAEALPLASGSVDLVFSSLAVQWCCRPEHLFAELARVLRPGGRCVFTSLGPLTLCELREAWAAVDTHQHVNSFVPMSALRDAAQRVPGISMHLDSRPVRLEYARVRDLLGELKALGAHNMSRGRPVGLTGRRALQGMLQAYEHRRSGGVLPATYDVIYGEVKKS